MESSKYSFLILATLALSACVNDDTDFSKKIESQDISAFLREAIIDESNIEEADTFASYYPDDYEELAETKRTVYIDFSNDNVNISGDTNCVDTTGSNKAHIVITPTAKKMMYVLSGSSDNGSIKFVANNDDELNKKFKVVLNNITLHNPHGAAINAQSGNRMFLILMGGTNSTLSDGKDYNFTPGEDMKGTIFSEGKIILSDSITPNGRYGTLNITSNYKHSIASDDYITVRPNVKLHVTSSDCALKGKDGVRILGGVLNLETDGVNGKGISSDSCVVVRGGRTIIIARGDGSKGISCNSNATLDGGSVNIFALGKETEDSKPRGLKADGNISISSDTYIYSKNSSAAESDTGVLNIKDGYCTLHNTNKHLLEVRY